MTERTERIDINDLKERIALDVEEAFSPLERDFILDYINEATAAPTELPLADAATWRQAADVVDDIISRYEPDVQGGILAWLAAVYLARHRPGRPGGRDTVMKLWLEALAEALPEAERELFGEGGLAAAELKSPASNRRLFPARRFGDYHVIVRKCGPRRRFLTPV